MTRRTTLVAVLVTGLAVVVTAVVLLTGPSGSATLDQRTREIAGELRCPTCDGESAADSNTPIARSMRVEVRKQLADGRTRADVLGWFRERYGEDIVMTPGSGGLGWLLWGAPIAALVLGAGVALGRRRGAVHGARRASRISGRQLVVAGVVVAAVGVGVPCAVAASSGPSTPPAAEQPDAAGWVAEAHRLDDDGEYAAASDAWREALSARPGSTTLRTRLAFDLLRSHRPAEATRLVRPVARDPGPDRTLAVLVLGLAQRQQGEPTATATLRRFLQLAPAHPAADQVRRLLREGS